ncbi:MAG: hypothetical protein KA214_00230 [Neisseriaceae bacterium]|nr:hypothetical protein [Neisseriaceae bacterium]
MNKFVWALLALSTAAMAENDRLNDHYQAPASHSALQEAELALPAYPNTKQASDWVAVYTTKTALTAPSLQWDSLALPGDGTVRYVLNIQPQSKKVDNLSVEALNCKDRTYKIYAFGNTFNQTWSANTQPQWIEIYSIDAVRHQMRQLFCGEGLPKNLDELKLRLSNQ